MLPDNSQRNLQPGPQPLRTPAAQQAILFYDGLCPLCHGAVRFLLRRDHHGALRFAPLQGALAQTLLARHQIPADANTAVLVLDAGTPAESIHLHSGAILQSLRLYGGGWAGCARLLLRTPCGPRDGLYRTVAALRRRLFGAYAVCPTPPPEFADRFLPGT